MKFSGKLGFVMTKENPNKPGIWNNTTEEHKATGDILSNSYRLESDSDAIKDLNFDCRISIVASKYIKDNIGYIKYVLYRGTKWAVKTAAPAYPRIILTLGGLYNG